LSASSPQSLNLLLASPRAVSEALAGWSATGKVSVFLLPGYQGMSAVQSPDSPRRELKRTARGPKKKKTLIKRDNCRSRRGRSSIATCADGRAARPLEGGRTSTICTKSWIVLRRLPDYTPCDQHTKASSRPNSIPVLAGNFTVPKSRVGGLHGTNQLCSQG
jgi:hypothetical protein